MRKVETKSPQSKFKAYWLDEMHCMYDEAYLVWFVLDQFFDAINNEQVFVVVVMSDVTYTNTNNIPYNYEFTGIAQNQRHFRIARW